MAFNLLIPEINNSPKSTKDAIINILTVEWPLSLRKIFYMIKKKYSYSYSYQSVYKAMKELVEKGVLTKKDKQYEINIGWIKDVQSFTDIVETNYYAKEKLTNISGLNESKRGEDMIILSFKSLFDAEKYLYYFMKNELSKKRNQIVCHQVNHEWKQLFYLRAEYNYFTKLKKKGHKFYFISSGDSSIEDVARKFYQSIGIKVHKSAGRSAANMLVFGDYFVQIFIPRAIEEKIGKFLNKKDAINLLKTLDHEGPIKVILHKDNTLASEMKKQIIKKFKK